MRHKKCKSGIRYPESGIKCQRNLKSPFICMKGLTLIEVLGAIVVFAILTALIMQVVTGSLVASKNIEIASRNNVLCSRKMDEIKAKILGRSTAPGYLFGWDKDYAEAATAFPAPDSDYKYTVSDPDYPVALIRDIAVAVWYDGDGDSIMDADEKNVVFNTKVAKRD